MNRTTKETTALGRFGVYGRPGDDEQAVLALALEYRERLADSHYREYMATVDLRNEMFPELLDALKLFEAVKSQIYQVEKRIKEHHSEVRDRNAVAPPDDSELRTLRQDRDRLAAEIKPLRKAWADVHSRFRQHKKDASPPCGWKQIQTLEKRINAYDAIAWPSDLREYAAVRLAGDIERRRLTREYQDGGLYFAIRGEIDEATKPKYTKTGPGVRYRWGRKPELRPWTNITMQFGGGGLPVRDAIAGRCPGFRITPIYTNHKASRTVSVVEVTQQMGTKEHPRQITYRCKLHVPLPATATLQRWTLVIDGRKRYAIPIVSGLEAETPCGCGILRCSLGWSAVSGGVRVASFASEHVREELIVPDWLISRRLGVAAAQIETDAAANGFLETRGIAASKTPGNGVLFGVSALDDYCGKHPADGSAAELLYQSQRRLDRARKNAARALRCIVKIYETAVHRLASLHDRIADDYTIDLQRLKRYSTRDLLRRDAPAKEVRERRDAVAPGKLQSLLRSSGMRHIASGDVPSDVPGTSRETVVIRSYVDSLGVKTGRKRRGDCHRSQYAMESESR
jgi:hypothetical protein